MSASISTSRNTIARSIRRLTIAVYILAILVALNVLASLFCALLPTLLTKRLEREWPSAASAVALNDFPEWPVRRKIKEASVIAIGRLQREGNRYKCIISEIVKQRAGTELFYKVGDEYREGGFTIRDNTDYGEGQIIFFTGSPAQVRYSTTYSGNRIVGLGDMPIQAFRDMVQQNPD
jgi:hypothetical protein